MILRARPAVNGYWNFANISKKDMVGDIFHDRMPINVDVGDGRSYKYFIIYNENELKLRGVYASDNNNILYYKEDSENGLLHLYLEVGKDVEYVVRMDDSVFNGNIVNTFSGAFGVENVDGLIRANNTYFQTADNYLNNIVGSDVAKVLEAQYTSAKGYMAKTPDINNLSYGLHYYDGWDVVPKTGIAPFTQSSGVWFRLGLSATFTVDLVFKINDAHVYISHDKGNTWIHS